MQRDDFFAEQETDAGPLEGLRVLEATAYGPGPLCGQVLCDLGAESIKIDLPGSGDPARHIPPFVSTEPEQRIEASVWHLTFNRGKRCITLDIRQPRGQDLFRQLVRRSDVLIESFTPGTMDAWGLGYDALSALQPGLIYLSISAFGQFGPWRERKGFDPMAQAMSGLMHVTGEPGGGPLRSGNATIDHMAAWHGAMGVMAALHHRDATGEGQWLDVGLTDVALYCSDINIMGAAGADYHMQRLGNAVDAAAPFDGYPSADGRHLFVNAAIDAHWARLCNLMQREDLLPLSYAERLQRRDEINAVVGAWIGKQPLETALAQLDEAGITCGPVLEFGDILEHPHFRERGSITTMADADFGDLTTYAPGPKLSRSPARIRGSAPRLGADNEAVYGSLGLDDRDREGLREDKII